MVAALILPAIAGALWLSAVSVFVRQVSSAGSPPRVAQWDGPIEDANLPEAAFLFEDEAWLIRFASLDDFDAEFEALTLGREWDHRLVVVHIDLPHGIAETGWDLMPILGGRRVELRGVARRADGGISLLLADGRLGLRAISLLSDRRAVDHGTVAVPSHAGVLGVRWAEGRLRAALRDGHAASWGEGPATLEIIEGCPQVDEFARDRQPVAARWTEQGWDVLVWDAPNQWRWTLSGESPARPQSGLEYGALGLRSQPFDELISPWPSGLGEPIDPEVRTRSSTRNILRATGEGTWENAAAAGGFWDWCLPGATKWVCVSHAPFEHRTRIFDGEGHDRTSELHPRFGPADPVVVESAASGFWVLDVSHTSAEGRIYYRLNDDLTRADPMRWGERYRRARPRTHEEALVWQATSGPSLMVLMDGDAAESIWLWIATLELPVELFGFPASVVLFGLLGLALRFRPRPTAKASVFLFAILLALMLWMGPGYVQVLPYV